MLFETEWAYQFGSNTDGSDHAAGMATIGAGRRWDPQGWQPTLWLYYDWASGDGDTGAGNGFHHLFPLGHRYFGFMDLFGRRNIEDLNLQLSIKPRDRLTLLFWYHYLFLETQSDVPYLLNMAPFNPGVLPGSPELGHEIDCLFTWAVGPRAQLAFGYSHFFAGDYYDTTPGTPFAGDADFFYTEWTFEF
jgi:hypothetical protein